MYKKIRIFSKLTSSSESIARSLGLPGAPKIKFKGRSDNKEKKNMSRQLAALSKSNNEGDVVPEEDKKVRTKYDRMSERKNQTILSDHYLNLTGSKADTAEKSDDDDEDFMAVKRQDHELRDDELPDLSIPVSKRLAKKALSKKASVAGKGNANKLKFDDDGVAHAIYELEDEEDFKKQGDARVQKDTFLNKETELMNNADIEDKLTAKEKRQEKKRKRKEMEKNMRQESDDEDENIQTVVSIGGDDIDLDRDLEHSSADEDVPEPKKPKWFDNDKNVNKDEDDGVVEYDEPQTLEDLEALTSKLLEH